MTIMDLYGINIFMNIYSQNLQGGISNTLHDFTIQLVHFEH